MGKRDDERRVDGQVGRKREGRFVKVSYCTDYYFMVWLVGVLFEL